jgi:hypothetical protein
MADQDKSKLFLLKSKLRATLPVPTQVIRGQDFKQAVIISHTSAGVLRSRADLTRPPVVAPSSESPLAIPRYNESLSENTDAERDLLHSCADCGRKFNAESLARHRRICRKVFKSKRKVFDSAKIRLSAIEEHLPGSTITPVASKKKRQIEQKPPTLKTNWRLKSMQFRSAIGAMRKENGGSYPILNTEDSRVPSSDSSLTHCPHCDRGFNADAAKRHIAVCQKLFGTKPGGGRLLRGAGTLSHSTMKKAEVGGFSSSYQLGRTTLKGRR